MAVGVLFIIFFQFFSRTTGLNKIKLGAVYPNNFISPVSASGPCSRATSGLRTPDVVRMSVSYVEGLSNLLKLKDQVSSKGR